MALCNISCRLPLILAPFLKSLPVFDMFKIFGKLQGVKDTIAEVKASLDDITVEAADAQKRVKVQVNGNKKVLRVEILEMGEKQDLEPAIQQAINLAQDEAKKLAQQRMKDRISKDYPEIAGMDLGGIL